MPLFDLRVCGAKIDTDGFWCCHDCASVVPSSGYEIKRKLEFFSYRAKHLILAY